jgi:hypothetical protein
MDSVTTIIGSHPNIVLAIIVILIIICIYYFIVTPRKSKPKKSKKYDEIDTLIDEISCISSDSAQGSDGALEADT